ncbi:MAG: CopL family metal-binding regulatory protein [Steroidobacteraceae bacterium]
MLHALLWLAVMLNGLTMPAASAMADAVAAPDMVMSEHHAGHGTMPEQAPPDEQNELPANGCCQAGDCDCGCTAPQLIAPRQAMTPRVVQSLSPVPAPTRAPHVSETRGAPFRPPA